MRTRRIKLAGRTAAYHLVSRTTGGMAMLDDLSKETLTGMFWKLAQFCGLEVITYCIDLNPVRAGLVEDPKDYRFCGYASAVAGNALARKGLMSFQGKPSWGACAAAYRMRLFVGGGAAHQSGKVVLDKEKIKEVIEQGGELSLGQVLRLRIRHLKAAFTLVELLVTIAIMGILTGLLLPALSHAKLKARQIKCLSNVRQLSLAAFLYASDQEKHAGYDNTLPGGTWVGALAAYVPEKELRVCPSAPLQQPPPATGNGQGSADRAWVRWTYDNKDMLYGSYGYNGWLYPDIVFAKDYLRSKEQVLFFNKAANIQHPALTPVFVDANWIDLWPLETDTVSEDLYNGRPFTAIHNDMGRCTIARHGNSSSGRATRQLQPSQKPAGAVNIGMADGHAELVKLEQLWKFDWHLDWKPPGIMPWK